MGRRSPDEYPVLETIRGSEVLCANQPHVGGLLAHRQPARIRPNAGGPQTTANRIFNAGAERQQLKLADVTASLQKSLENEGMTFTKPDRAAFRDALPKPGSIGVGESSPAMNFVSAGVGEREIGVASPSARRARRTKTAYRLLRKLSIILLRRRWVYAFSIKKNASRGGAYVGGGIAAGLIAIAQMEMGALPSAAWPVPVIGASG